MVAVPRQTCRPIRATYVRKTQEVERVRFLAGLRQVPSGKSPEAHDPRLFFCQLQSEFLNRSLKFCWNSSASRRYWKFATSRVARGITPPGAHRSGRERLRSSGSYRPVVAWCNNGQWAKSRGSPDTTWRTQFSALRRCRHRRLYFAIAQRARRWSR
jgi:hypothetical protein